MSTGHRFYIVEKNDTLWGIAKRSFNLSTDRDVANKVNELKRINPQLKNPDSIDIGSPLFMGLEDGGQSPAVNPQDVHELEACFKNASPKTRDTMLKHWGLLQLMNQHMQPTLRQGPTFLSQVQKRPSSLAQDCGEGATCKSGMDSFMETAAVGSDVLEASFKTFHAGAVQGMFPRFRVPPASVFQSLEGSLVEGVKNQIKYLALKDGTLRLIPNGARLFDINGRMVVVQPSASGGLAAFTKTTQAIKWTAENLEKYGGKITVGIDFGVGLYEVDKAWGTANQGRVIAKEATKFGAKTAFGALFAADLGATICGGITLASAEIGGIPGAACYLIVVGGTAWGVGETGGYLAEKIYGWGTSMMNSIGNGLEQLYRSAHPMYIPYYRGY